MRRTGTTRRGALTAAGAVASGAVLAGCGGGGDGDGARAGAGTSADRISAERAETALMTAARETGATLLARYESVIAAHPATAPGLAPLRDAVRAHVVAFGKGTGASLSAVRTRPGTTTAAAAVRALATAERQAAAAHTEALMEAPPELARLLASVAAAASAHAYLLTALAKETEG